MNERQVLANKICATSGSYEGGSRRSVTPARWRRLSPSPRKNRPCRTDTIADDCCPVYSDIVNNPDLTSKPSIADRLARLAIPVSLSSLSIALIGPIVPISLGVPMAIAGLVIFTAAALLSGYAMFTIEMKSAEELGFERNRDLLLYVGSPAGMDWKLSTMAFIALAVSFLVGFGAFAKPNGGGALLAFATFAFLGSVARIQRKWPNDKSNRAGR